MSKYYVGIDTSAYTTSLAVIDEMDNIILDLRKVLDVKKGQKGLRQQDAVFQHINNMPFLIEQMANEIDITKIKTISCSSKPRNIEGSYMPVFIVGKGQAFILSKVIGTEYKEFSHQEGHIGVGILKNNIQSYDRFVSLHISGGTTELLLVDNKGENLHIDIIGGTLDLSVGQLLDRIGVNLRMKFPCGQGMDAQSQKGTLLDIKIPINIRDNTWLNFSGMENYFMKLIHSGQYNMEDVLATLFYVIGEFFYKIIKNSCIQHKIDNILITGGVSSNKIIREYLLKELGKQKITSFFPEKKLCTDNSVGIAHMGKIKKGYFSG